jgi:hypothetical protein
MPLGGPTAINVSSISGRTSFPAADSSPLAIISISLEGMGQSSAIPSQTLALIQHYYTGERTNDLNFISLEFSLEDGTEDKWIQRLDRAIAPLIKYVDCNY